MVQQGVSTLLTKRVVHVCLARHDVKQVTGHLNEKPADSIAAAVLILGCGRAAYLQPATEIFHGATIRRFSDQCEAVGALC